MGERRMTSDITRTIEWCNCTSKYKSSGEVSKRSPKVPVCPRTNATLLSPSLLRLHPFLLLHSQPPPPPWRVCITLSDHHVGSRFRPAVMAVDAGAFNPNLPLPCPRPHSVVESRQLGRLDRQHLTTTVPHSVARQILLLVWVRYGKIG